MRDVSRDEEIDVQRLRKRAAEIAADPCEDLDPLLTDCAAVALKLRAQRVRVEREIDEVRDVAASVRALREGIGEQALAS